MTDQELIDKPLHELLASPSMRDRAVEILLHRLWGKGHDGLDYVKKEWGTFQVLIQGLQKDANAGCPACNDRHQHEAEADDGMRNAAEIAGLQ